ncbi:MAG: exodeoxyribonuclease VII small subunit [Phormidium tanganyikae FI6-MK23]|jgi:exodeoxyribonuclease VII small subunit|nr:exodeoxyribonuclease VII small subunit [Phormidium tanganyikae FI6-MK23]
MNPSSQTKSEKLPRLSAESWNYEDTVARVERILTRIESGELELADVFEEFSAAVEHLRQCEAFLAERQKQVDLLIETLIDESEF